MVRGAQGVVGGDGDGGEVLVVEMGSWCFLVEKRLKKVIWGCCGCWKRSRRWRRKRWWCWW